MTAGDNAQVTSVTVTYHSASTMQRLLASLKRCSDAGVLRPVVVDNASQDATPQLLRQAGDWLEVVLASDNLGVVIEQSPQSLLTPVVKVFFSIKSGNYQTPRLLDLADPKAGDKIVSREDAAKWGVKDLDRFWAHP